MSSRRWVRGPRGGHRGWLVLPLVALLVAACGAAPPRIGPSGVDGLTIPTPSPDPRDFVAAVNNPWFPLAPAARWTYQVTSTAEHRTPVRAEVTVDLATETVAGVTTTQVHTVVSDRRGRPVRTATSCYAQDAAGNVWLFCEESVSGKVAQIGWRAGDDEARAGLAMAATPRVGDGYQLGGAPGVAQDQARVLSIEDLRDTPYGSFDHLTAIEQSTPLEPGLQSHQWYAAGVGLVAVQAVTANGFEEWTLTDYRPE